MNSSSIIVLQIGHNPTGVDPTFSQWRQIAEVIKVNLIDLLKPNSFLGPESHTTI
jgi:aspartate/tyrosine/aromatic aminotransferase